jgi:hypothetical protein
MNPKGTTIKELLHRWALWLKAQIIDPRPELDESHSKSRKQ